MVAIFSTRYSDTSWHVGEEKTDIKRLARRVIEVQADGHELGYILEHIKGIREAPNNIVVRWTGDDAWFIWKNF